MIVFTLLVFLSLVEWVVFIDVVLSWTVLLGVRFRPRFIQSITIPLYEFVRRFIPTGFRGVDFAPIVIVIVIELASNLLTMIDPSALTYFPR